jgi:alpha-glucan phosphorylase-like protein
MRTALPARLKPLEALARNLWWSWHPEAVALFQELDPDHFETLRHNPVGLLQDLGPERFQVLAKDPAYLARLQTQHQAFQSYLASQDTWFTRRFGATARETPCVAYFSMEFGLHESLRLYSGGLGILAGDHVRSASDLGLPFVGVGLLYRQGYFRQVVDGRQQVACYPVADFSRLPLTRLEHGGEPLSIDLPIGTGIYRAHAWQLDVGRVRLFLLDTDLASNPPEIRALTQRLYGGDAQTRIAQEVLLGIGGVRLLRALGIEPGVVHLNEGHCAFAPLERHAQRLIDGADWSEAMAATQAEAVFTTHTPVPAGHDRFSWRELNGALQGYRESLGWGPGKIMDLGRVRPGDLDETLCMTVLALKTTRMANGVSELHGQVSREMWCDLFPGVPVDDVPIGHITNGVHPIFWMHPRWQALYDRSAPGWRKPENLCDPAFWVTALAGIDDKVLWEIHNDCRQELIAHVGSKVRNSRLSSQALTIGFARRFAPYKRANLLFSQPDRLAELVQGPAQVQLIFAGKAHPRDGMGQAIAAEVMGWCDDPRFRGKIVFLEDYDIHIGRMLVSGVDVWLNNPRRPREASGTSGQKVPLNGGINLSVLDGWWPEAYDGSNGWAIGKAQDYSDISVQDHDDAESLFALLEQQVAPMFLDREQQIPVRWVAMMRRSIATCVPAFNTHRMVRDYAEEIYFPVRGSTAVAAGS